MGESSDSRGNATLRGSIYPHIHPETWPVWTPDAKFQKTFDSWADEPSSETLVWCQAFIPQKNTSEAMSLNGKFVVPLHLPLHIPVPGYFGQCAGIDGRDWAPHSPYQGGRPSKA